MAGERLGVVGPAPPRYNAGRMPTRVAAAAVILVAVSGLACGTVDVGDPPADVNACRPSQRFFVERVWPELLEKKFGAKSCVDGGCHGAGSPRLLLLARPTSEAGDFTKPDWQMPPAWEMVYRATTEQLSCTNPTASALLTRPDGRQTHGGEKLFEPDGPEATLIKMWIAAR